MARIFDVIESIDETAAEMVTRVPQRGSGDFRIGSQLIVRESQAAVFFRDGQALDTFGPGRHTITTANVPLLVGLIGKAFSGQTPFKAEVYFVSLREFTDLKWGTPTPITIKDSELGMARVQARGSYGVQIMDPQLFVNKIVGTQGLYRTSNIEGFFRSMILTKIADLIAESGESVIKIAAMTEEIVAGVRAKTAEEFAARGAMLTSVYAEYIGPTEETAKAIDERASMGAIGDMQAYMQFQAARGMRDAAQQPAGTAGAGVGLGAGLGMGAAMAQMMAQSMQQPTQQQPPQQQPAQQPAGPATPSTPSTAEEVRGMLDNLDARLMNGEISEELYNNLRARWEARLDEFE